MKEKIKKIIIVGVTAVLIIAGFVSYYYLFLLPSQQKGKLTEWCRPDCFYFPEKESWGYNPLFSMYVDLLEFHNITPENADWFAPSQEKCIEFCIENELRFQRKIEKK